MKPRNLFYCLAYGHNHGTREEEIVCSANHQLEVAKKEIEQLRKVERRSMFQSWEIASKRRQILQLERQLKELKELTDD